jgi:exo-beta-1,3-glucanase (GH17 family)
MRKLFLVFLPFFLFWMGCQPPTEKTQTTTATKVEVKDGWYYLNGERFFIKAIGYEIGARPGQNPYKDTISDLGRVRFDMNVIKDAGFNTIRTWSQMSEEQLKVVQESGMKIIFGIWILPEGPYGDAEFMKNQVSLVEKVVSYTKNYDCVISYLILNEPMTDHIYKCGAKEMANMLTTLKGILNTQHPGIPVGISGNASTNDFMDMNLLDFYGYNCYDYSNGQCGTLGYTGFLSWCKNLNQNKKPMIITEFGYSVSDLGFGKYGGNTLEEQKYGVVRNYRELIDAGAVGACPFYYADGWWKGGEPAVHNNTAEEWFGYWGYSDLNDTIGAPRPVWYALSSYLKGLVISPKNQQVYGTEIPVELFLDTKIRQVIVRLHDSVLYTKTIEKAGYLADKINYLPKGTEDAELIFEFYDAQKELVKTESIFTLLSKEPVQLPKLTINVTPDDLANGKKCDMKIAISDLGNFKIQGEVRYNFNFHMGWDAGPEGILPLKDNKLSFEVSNPIPENCWVLVPSAGVTVSYGKYYLRLHDQKMIFRGNWYEGIGRR